MLLDVLHLCAGFSLILTAVYACAMRSHWLPLAAAALLMTVL